MSIWSRELLQARIYFSARSFNYVDIPRQKFPKKVVIQIPYQDNTALLGISAQILSLSQMSTASKLTLLGTTLGTAGIVAFVHWAQEAEKTVRPSLFRAITVLLEGKNSLLPQILHQISSTLTNLETYSVVIGNARGRCSRHGATTHQERATIGF